MKNYFLLFISMVLLFSFISCDNDNESTDYGLGEIKNYHELFFDTRWISVMGNDSVIISFECWRDTTYSNAIIIDYYYIGDTSAEYKKFEMYMRGSVLTDNSLELSYYSSYYSDDRDRIIPFTIDNDKLVLSGFANDMDYIFYKQSRKREYPDINILSGTWITTLNRDSTVLFFANGAMTEYIYERNTKEVLRYTRYDKYFLNRYVYTWRGTTKSEDKIHLYNNRSEITDIIKYSLLDNKLVIYKNENLVIYNKEK